MNQQDTIAVNNHEKEAPTRNGNITSKYYKILKNIKISLEIS